MSDAIIHDAPDLSAVLTPNDPWRLNQRAFMAMLPSLLATHRGQYVAVHDGHVVASGDALVDVALEAYRRVGYLPVYVDLVTDRPRPRAGGGCALRNPSPAGGFPRRLSGRADPPVVPFADAPDRLGRGGRLA